MLSKIQFIAVCALGLLLVACDDATPEPVPVLAVRGAAIDGSEDPIVASDEEQAEEAPEKASVESVSARASGPQQGPLDISYQDLSLIEYDVDAMLDYMLFPDEYDEEDAKDLAFPRALTELMNREVSIVGYMIPGEMEQGRVTDFMLVRDLLGCCFGGSPMPDEWLDVIMVEGQTAEYRPYLPMRVTGTMTLGGEQDEAGFAMGIYRMSATDVVVED